jgi:hypothetical protein
MAPQSFPPPLLQKISYLIKLEKSREKADKNNFFSAENTVFCHKNAQKSQTNPFVFLSAEGGLILSLLHLFAANFFFFSATTGCPSQAAKL